MSALTTVTRFLTLAFIFLFLFPLGFPAPAHARDDNAGEPVGFKVLTLQRPGVMLLAASGDLNGDGEADLLLFHKPSREAYEKFCSVYFQQEGEFADNPQLEIALGKSVSAVEIEDIDSDERDELCSFDDGGMMVFRLGAESSVESNRLLEYQTLLPIIGRRIVAVNWIAAIDSDGRMNVVLPVADGIRLFMVETHGGPLTSQTLELPINASVSGEGGQNYVNYRLPAIEFSDFDNDGHTDVGVFDLERMDFFLTGDSKMPGVHLTAPLVRKFTKDFVGATDFRDLNADGIPDATVVLISQKKNLQSEVQIYFGDNDLSYGEEPAHIYSGEESLILPMFLDATGDGKMEMLLQNINVGIGFFLNYFLTNRIRVDTELRKLSSNGRYDDKPAARHPIYVRVSESGAEPARNVADFDGDGLDDLVVGTAENRLSFFLSDKKTILPKRPTFAVNAPAYGKMSILNLNADGRADLIILYTQEDKRDIATLLLSR